MKYDASTLHPPPLPLLSQNPILTHKNNKQHKTKRFKNSVSKSTIIMKQTVAIILLSLMTMASARRSSPVPAVPPHKDVHQMGKSSCRVITAVPMFSNCFTSIKCASFGYTRISIMYWRTLIRICIYRLGPWRRIHWAIRVGLWSSKTGEACREKDV